MIQDFVNSRVCNFFFGYLFFSFRLKNFFILGFLDINESANQFGELVQCIDEDTGEILWLCEKHRDGYRSRETESEVPSSRRNSSNQYPKNDVFVPSRILIPVETIYVPPKSCINLSQKLNYVCKILYEIIENAHVSGKKLFKSDDIREIALKMSSHVNKFKLLFPTWNNEKQKETFISILENQEHLYIHFLRLIVRYFIGKLFS
jgi:hypothetical protein